MSLGTSDGWQAKQLWGMTEELSFPWWRKTQQLARSRAPSRMEMCLCQCQQSREDFTRVNTEGLPPDGKHWSFKQEGHIRYSQIWVWATSSANIRPGTACTRKMGRSCSDHLYHLEHRCQTQGPRAKCGSPRLFMWPVRADKVCLFYNKDKKKKGALAINYIPIMYV